jgi:hypothetical protein
VQETAKPREPKFSGLALTNEPLSISGNFHWLPIVDDFRTFLAVPSIDFLSTLYKLSTPNETCPI